jgi:lysophospholipase L1-like esterase
VSWRKLKSEKSHNNIQSVLEKLKTTSTLSVVGLGDSLTYGWMVERGFFDRFCDGLYQKYPGSQVKRTNLGVPGSTAAEGHRRISSVVENNPDLVIIQFGLNDCFSGLTVSSFGSALERLIEPINPNERLIVLVTSCPVVDRDFQKRLDPFYMEIIKLGQQYDLPVADLANYWDANKQSDDEPLYQSDGVHPTDAGHQLMAQGLLSFFSA